MTATCEDRSTVGQLRAMANESVRRARAKIDGTDTCIACRKVADSWYRNLPRTDCEWPGSQFFPVAPRRAFLWPGREDVAVGPFFYRTCPRMDARTPGYTKVAEWDVKNYGQIALIFDICRAAGHAR